MVGQDCMCVCMYLTRVYSPSCSRSLSINHKVHLCVFVHIWLSIFLFFLLQLESLFLSLPPFLYLLSNFWVYFCFVTGSGRWDTWAMSWYVKVGWVSINHIGLAPHHHGPPLAWTHRWASDFASFFTCFGLKITWVQNKELVYTVCVVSTSARVSQRGCVCAWCM